MTVEAVEELMLETEEAQATANVRLAAAVALLALEFNHSTW